MSNDTYSGSSLNNLRPTTPEDADGFNVDARALRQIKRFLKNSDGLIQTITDILTKEDSTILDKFKGSQVYSRPDAVIALRADVNPNDSDKYRGRWEKLNGVSICGTGNAGFNTFPFTESNPEGNFPIVEHNVVFFPHPIAPMGSLYSQVLDSTVRIVPNFASMGNEFGTVYFTSEKFYVIFPIYPELNNKITVKINVVGNGDIYVDGVDNGWSCLYQSGGIYYGLPFSMWLSNDNQGNTKHSNYTGRPMKNNTSGVFTIEKAYYGSTPYLLLDFGDPYGWVHEANALNGSHAPYIDITVTGDSGKFGRPDYKLTWVLTASQYSNCTLDPITEKHSDRTYRLMLRVYRNQNTTASLNKIYFYTQVGNLNDLEAVSFSIKNAWSLFADGYMNNWPYLAMSHELFKTKYPNYRIKVTLSKSPTYDPAGVVIGEATIEDYLKNGIYFNNVENTIKEVASGYIVISIMSPSSVEFTEDTGWWLVDAEVTVNLKRSYKTENYSTYNVELNKDYTSSLPLQGINFWKRIDDGTERDSNTD